MNFWSKPIQLRIDANISPNLIKTSVILTKILYNVFLSW